MTLHIHDIGHFNLCSTFTAFACCDEPHAPTMRAVPMENEYVPVLLDDDQGSDSLKSRTPLPESLCLGWRSRFLGYSPASPYGFLIGSDSDALKYKAAVKKLNP